MKTYDNPELAFRAYSAALNSISRSAMPLAARGTLNALAYESRQRIVNKEMPKKFTIRNSFEQRSVQFKRSANTFKIEEMESSAGQVSVMKFQRGPKKMDDLRKQELGEVQGPRDGSKLVRTPTISARIGKSNSRPVAKRNRAGVQDWLTMRDIEAVVGVKTGGTRHGRIRRAHALARKYKARFGRSPYILPKYYGRGADVFRPVRNTVEKIHSLSPKKKKLKKRPVVKPGYETIVRTRADKIWAEQASKRIVKAAAKTLGL